MINCGTFPLIKASWHPDLVLRLLSEAAQLSKFQLDTRDLGQRAVCGPSGGVGRSLPNVDVREGDLRWSIEGWHQPGPEVFLEKEAEEFEQHIQTSLKDSTGARAARTHSFVKKELISRQMVGAQQTTQDANSRLKQVDVRILAEGQLLLHPALRLCKLWSDAQDNTQRQ